MRSFEEVLHELGMAKSWVYYHTLVGHLPQWHKRGHVRLFSPEQVEEIKDFLAAWRQRKEEIKNLKNKEIRCTSGK
jgi:predicted DNA-binding transcriptional regulator AlpA